MLLFDCADEIREDIEDVVSRLKPWANTDGNTEFGGWARMALPISTFSVVEVGRPNVGENRPSRVRADVTVELNVADSVKMEWEGENVGSLVNAVQQSLAEKNAVIYLSHAYCLQVSVNMMSVLL